VPVTEVTLRPGEPHKTLASVTSIWDAALAQGIDRDAVVVGFGGGVVGDLAGFAASTLLRGVRVVQVPTTLLAMVDASLGGKTGFDHPSGKNLLGSFHQPTAVIVDLAHLSTLPRRELVAGFAEVAKIALACDEELWLELESKADALVSGPSADLAPIVSRAIQLKARIVADDELDSSARLVLNLGHTAGHALEAASGFTRYLHGEAVALGMLAELETCERLGRGGGELLPRVRSLLRRLHLPTEVPAADLARAWSHVTLDKKGSGGTLRLPVVHSVGVTVVEVVSRQALAQAVGAPPSAY
jgi:3-dehydroquinate synthase